MSLTQNSVSQHCVELIERSREFLYQVDAAGTLSYLNPFGESLLEITPESWRSRSLIDFVHEDDRSRLQAALQAVLDTSEPQDDVEVRMVSMRGNVIWTNHALSPMHASGTGVGALGSALDVGGMRRLEEQLQQSQKLETIGLLAGGIAHDFNNMLAAILGFTELMIEERSAGDPDLRTLSYIQKSTERAASLVKQLLVYSRKTTAELKPLRLGEVVHETLDIIERTLPKNIRIVAFTDEPDDAILGDYGRIQQALLNLCLNSRDAMPRGGELRITVENMGDLPGDLQDGHKPGQYVRIKVQDTGTGIGPEVLQKIWEPFFTTKEPGKGTGLGLSLVQSIVNAHGGFVQVESQPGSGTSFYLYLPAVAVQSPAQGTGLQEPPGGSETVLVVDDEAVLLDLLVDILSRKGYRVLSVHSGQDALDTLKAADGRIDLVISDNMMPGMMGRDLAREIRTLAPKTRVVLCSGYSTGTDIEPGEADNVSAYVQKPYQRRELLTRVREVLDRRR